MYHTFTLRTYILCCSKYLSCKNNIEFYNIANGKLDDLKRRVFKLTLFSSDKFTCEAQFTTLPRVVRVWAGYKFYY